MKQAQYSILLIASILILGVAAIAQQPAKIKRPVKNPPQYPNIIDLEGKERPASPAAPTEPNAAPAQTAPAQADDLSRAVASLAGEMKSLAREIRTLNMRNQAQLDTLRLTRIDMRIDHYERELRPVRDRLGQLEADENTLTQLMTREGLQAQTASMATLNRDELMKQLRFQHETRLRAVQGEKERLKKLEADLLQSLSIYQKLSSEAEQRIQGLEEGLRRIEGDPAPKPEPKPVN
jgi:hypothetical protein